MADARVIGIDGRAKSTANVLAGADRASGERARRRTTPLLPPESASPSARATAKKATPAKKAATAAPKKAATKKAAPAKAAPKKAAPASKAVAAKTPARKARVTEISSARNAAPPASAAPAPRPVATRASDIEQPLPSGGKHSIALAIATQIGEALLDAVISRAKTGEIEDKISSILSFVRRRLTGDYELDEFGFDPEFTEKIPLALLKPLYKHWFRVEVRGIENIPAEGGALVVANHSGTLPLDAVMTAVAVHEAHPQKRFLRTLGADLVFQTPFLAGFARRSGSTLASNPDAEKLLAGGHLVGVWPEGFKGIGKPFSERYKLQRFGRGGFVSAALRTGTPIIPCSIVGAEEIYPIIGDIPSLARLLGLPYLPITPFFPLLGPLGAIPLPSKWLIEFAPPVVTSEYGKHAADDPMLVFDLTDQVRQSIQQTLYSLLVQRRSIFF